MVSEEGVSLDAREEGDGKQLFIRQSRCRQMVLSNNTAAKRIEAWLCNI